MTAAVLTTQQFGSRAWAAGQGEQDGKGRVHTWLPVPGRQPALSRPDCGAWHRRTPLRLHCSRIMRCIASVQHRPPGLLPPGAGWGAAPAGQKSRALHASGNAGWPCLAVGLGALDSPVLGAKQQHQRQQHGRGEGPGAGRAHGHHHRGAMVMLFAAQDGTVLHPEADSQTRPQGLPNPGQFPQSTPTGVLSLHPTITAALLGAGGTGSGTYERRCEGGNARASATGAMACVACCIASRQTSSNKQGMVKHNLAAHLCGENWLPQTPTGTSRRPMQARSSPRSSVW